MSGLLMTMRKECKLIFRNGITIYLAISPAVLALVFIFIFRSVQEASVSLVVDESLPQEVAAQLETVADIEFAEDLESLNNRVSGADSIAGVYMEDGKIKLLVEGNEAQGFAESRKRLVSAALSTENIEYMSEAVESESSLAYNISMTCIFLLAMFIGGATLGLGGVNERESGVIRAVSVSPMTLWGYMISKIVPATLFGVIGVSACSLIIGRADILPQFVLLALCSVFVSGIIIFLIIAYAGNQIAAVGVLKIIMPLFLVVGISAVFIPREWLVFFYALPMYWQYAAIDAISSNKEPMVPLLMILVTGIPWFIAVMFIFTKKINMRAWR